MTAHNVCLIHTTFSCSWLLWIKLQVQFSTWTFCFLFWLPFLCSNDTCLHTNAWKLPEKQLINYNCRILLSNKTGHEFSSLIRSFLQLMYASKGENSFLQWILTECINNTYSRTPWTQRELSGISVDLCLRLLCLDYLNFLCLLLVHYVLCISCFDFNSLFFSFLICLFFFQRERERRQEVVEVERVCEDMGEG